MLHLLVSQGEYLLTCVFAYPSQPVSWLMCQRQACNKDVVQKRDDWRTRSRPEVKEGRERINTVTKSQNSDYSYFRHARSPVQELLLLHKTQRCNCIIRKHLRLEKTHFTHQRLRNVTPVGLFKAGLSCTLPLSVCLYVLGFSMLAAVSSVIDLNAFIVMLFGILSMKGDINELWLLAWHSSDKCPLWSEPK